MSRGKYSPVWEKIEEHNYNALGETPVPYTPGVDTFDPETMFANYDAHGFDSYGYSAYDEDGIYVGDGNGVDRLGYTEHEYITMSDDLWEIVTSRESIAAAAETK